MSETESRPSAVTTACWLLVIGAVLLIAGGLLASLASFDTLRKAQPPTVPDESVHHLVTMNRGIGILFVLAGVGLVWLAARARRRDLRFRRAAMALALTIIVLVSVASVFAGHILALLSLVPIIVGTLLMSRTGVLDWYAGG
jgi:hypothetical protein